MNRRDLVGQLSVLAAGAALWMTTDFAYTRDTIALAERKAAQGKAPVYLYRFAWETPVDGGRMRSHHSREISFVFDNTSTVPGPTGGGPKAAALAATMSAAWVAFARSGNRGTPALAWPVDTRPARETMVFNNECKVARDFGAAERHLWATV